MALKMAVLDADAESYCKDYGMENARERKRERKCLADHATILLSSNPAVSSRLGM